MKGKVKWFVVPKGYGVIAGEDGNEYLVHHAEIRMEGFKKLREWQKVEFRPGTYDGKPNTMDVVLETKGAN